MKALLILLLIGLGFAILTHSVVLAPSTLAILLAGVGALGISALRRWQARVQWEDHLWERRINHQ